MCCNIHFSKEKICVDNLLVYLDKIIIFIHLFIIFVVLYTISLYLKKKILIKKMDKTHK